MPQDDSKQCAHLLSQEICPRCSDYLISVRFQFYLTISHTDLQLPNWATGVQRSDIVHIIDDL
eukprot:1821415-Prymnesium_polylepis.1